MVRFFTFLAALSVWTSFAQFRVGQQVKSFEDRRASFQTVTVLQPKSEVPNATIENVVAESTVATLQTAAIQQIYNQRPQTLEVVIPYQGASVVLRLYRVNPFAEGFKVLTHRGETVSYTPGVYYRGIIKNDYRSVASLTFFENSLSGLISGSTFQNLVVGPLKNSSDYIVYSDAKMKVPHPFQCLTDDGPAMMRQARSVPNTTQSAKCATTYFEMDYNLYQENGSDTTTATNWMTAVYNNVQTLFENDGITIAFRTLLIWTEPDPYEGIGTSSVDYLFKFNEVRPVFDGDVGQLLGIDAGGLGGVAVTIDGLCSSQNFCYSDVEFDFQTVPTYSWTVLVLTHEFGHILGAPHTHACIWNGNNTAIDNCATAGIGPTAEGASCSTDPLTIPSSGTIMSYCHLVSNVGIDLANGFGPQPAQRILDTFALRSCLSSDCVNTCINTVERIVLETTTQTSATFNWIDVTGATAWRVRYYLFGTTPGSWTTMTTNTLTATNLTPNSYYVIEVAPECPSGLEIWGRQLIFMTYDVFCTGSVFTDTGGATGDYDDEQTMIRTLIPNVPANSITLTFSQFSLEQDYDYLYIYDGNSTAAPEFNGGLGFTGNQIPGPFVSSATDGSLTLQFKSDAFVTDAGWVANIGCTPNLNTGDFQGIDFTYYPNPSNGQVFVTSKTNVQSVVVHNVMGQLLLREIPRDSNFSIDITAFAQGTYFVTLQFEEGRLAHFKVVKK